MAGIGFTLRRLTRRDDLAGALVGYGHSVFISAGPWLFTVLALVGINTVLNEVLAIHDLQLFRSVIVYNFSVSLVLTGPVILISTRYLADRIFERRLESVIGLLAVALASGTLPGLLLAAVFYLAVCTLDPLVAMLAVANYGMISAIWICSLFLSALKAYSRVSIGFALGMAAALLATVVLGPQLGVPGALLGFTAGLALTLTILAGSILAEYRFPVRQTGTLLGYVKSHWDLAVGGLAYNLGIWIDKWLVWWLNPDTVTVGGALVTAPIYDGAMFLAYLTIVPALAIFTVTVETDFFECYQRFYRGIGEHATLVTIRQNQQAVVQATIDGLRSVLVFQAVIAALVIFLAPAIIEATDGAFRQVGVFRFGVLGAVFHVLSLICLIMLQYFDARRLALWVQVVFLATNGLFTWVTLEFGFAYLGYGYFLAALATFVISVLALLHVLRQLPYIAFVRNNPAVTEAR